MQLKIFFVKLFLQLFYLKYIWGKGGINGTNAVNGAIATQRGDHHRPVRADGNPPVVLYNPLIFLYNHPIVLYNHPVVVFL